MHYEINTPLKSLPKIKVFFNLIISNINQIASISQIEKYYKITYIFFSTQHINIGSFLLELNFYKIFIFNVFCGFFKFIPFSHSVISTSMKS